MYNTVLNCGKKNILSFKRKDNMSELLLLVVIKFSSFEEQFVFVLFIFICFFYLFICLFSIFYSFILY